jgi:hypothetical protein
MHAWYDAVWPYAPATAKINTANVTMAAIVVVVTTLRYFHGNVMWNYVAFGSRAAQPSFSFAQRIWLRLSAYYIHMGQYALFYFCGLSILDPERFIKGMFWVSAVDVVWTLWSWQTEVRPILRRALGTWLGLNILTGLACLALWLYPFDRQIQVVAGLYSVVTIVDYALNAQLFFGEGA